jgi:hypothetical protein
VGCCLSAEQLRTPSHLAEPHLLYVPRIVHRGFFCRLVDRVGIAYDSSRGVKTEQANRAVRIVMGFDPSKVREISEEKLQEALGLLQPGRSLHTVCKLELDRRQRLDRRKRRWWAAWTTLLIGLTSALFGFILGRFL